MKVHGRLGQTITDFSRDMISLYGYYKSGFLPQSGGILDQDNRYAEAMIAMESAKQEV